jgi:hypothetical protein
LRSIPEQPERQNTAADCSATFTDSEVVALDSCDSSLPAPTYTTSTETGACAASFVLKRTWQVTDASSNVASHSQTIDVSDTAAPDALNINPDTACSVASASASVLTSVVAKFGFSDDCSTYTTSVTCELVEKEETDNEAVRCTYDNSTDKITVASVAGRQYKVTVVAQDACTNSATFYRYIEIVTDNEAISEQRCDSSDFE